MLRAGLVAIVAMVSVADAAPIRVVRGTITDHKTGAAIDGAIVLGQYATAISAGDGTFEIKLDPAEQELAITAPGYNLRTVQIGTAPLVVDLDPGGEQIEVSGTAPMQTKPQTYQLTDDDIRLLPGTGNDALRAIQALPGVARIPYSFGGLVLRGSSPRDNAVYIDGIEVPIAFHFGGVTSFYPSGMLSNLTLTTGGFDAEYGRAKGGIVTLTTREPRTDRWRTGGSIGLLDSAVYAEGPVADGGVLIGIRRSYFDIVAIAFAPDSVPLPSYWDGQIRGSFGDPERGGRWSPMLFFSFDNVSITSAGQNGHEDETTMSSLFVRAAVQYLRQWGPLSLHVVPWLGANQLSFTSVTNGVAETFDRPEYPTGVRADLTREMTWGELRGGLDTAGSHLTHLESGLGQPGDILPQTNGTTTVDWFDVALWGEAQVKLPGDRIALKPNVRVEHYGLTGEVVADPRLALHERLTESLTLRETLGRYHQPPTAADLDPNGGNPDLKSSYFDQAALGIDGDLDNGWSGSITGYYNSGHNLGVRTTSDANDFSNLGALGPTFELLLEKQLGLAFPRANVGRAEDYGVELLIRRQTPRWFGMIAYTLANAQRTDDPALSYGWRPFELDQRHNLNVVGSVKLTTWRIGARIQLVSGDPYTPTIDGVPQAPFSANLPWFFQLDLRADRRWHRCWGDINLYIDIQNATNRSNIEGRDTFTNTDVAGLPIAPFIGVEFLPT